MRRKCFPTECPVCHVVFQPERLEQKYCTKECGHKARSERALNKKQLIGKRCAKCKVVKLLSCFSRNRAVKDGFSHECKPCKALSRQATIHRARMSLERWEVYKATFKRGQSAMLAVRMEPRSNGTKNEWLHHLMQDGRERLAPPSPFKTEKERLEAYRLKANQRYATDSEYKEAKKEYQRLRHLANPWVMLARKHRRDARLAGALDDFSVTSQAIRTLWESTIECIYCGRELNEYNKSLEHLIPISGGGVHATRNVAVVCRLCNETKKAKPFDEWVCLLKEPWRSISHDVLIQNEKLGSLVSTEPCG